MREFTFTWFIENFSYCWHDEGECIHSPTFFIEMMQNTSCNLILYPRGYDFDISLYLSRSHNGNGPEEIAFDCELSILDANGEALKSRIMEMNERIQKKEMYVISEFYERPEINQVKRGFALDVLRLRCRMWMDEEGDDEEVLCYAKTRIVLQKISFIKTFETFGFLEPNQKIPFNVTPVSGKALKLSGNVYIKSEPGSEDEVILEICRFGNKSQKFDQITCKIFTLDSEGNEVQCGEIDSREEMCSKSTMIDTLHLGKRNSLDKKHECLSKNELTLRFECTSSTKTVSHAVDDALYNPHLIPLLKERIRSKYFAPVTIVPKSVTDDLRYLYTIGILSDFQIKTANKTFPVHKSVLCARSSVLRAMLTTDMTEKVNDVIQIDDLDETTIDLFLVFLYTDILEDHTWENIMKLYYAADKYNVQPLKELCTSFLITGCSENNMSDVLILADRYQDSILMLAVEKFICNMDKQKFFNKKWKRFTNINPRLAAKIVYIHLKNYLVE